MIDILSVLRIDAGAEPQLPLKGPTSVRDRCRRVLRLTSLHEHVHIYSTKMAFREFADQNPRTDSRGYVTCPLRPVPFDSS